MNREQTEYAELQQKLMNRLDTSRELKDEEICEQIDRLLMEKSSGHYYSLKRRAQLRTELFNAVRKLDILQELVDNDQVTEIMVNGLDGIFIEEKGHIRKWEKGFQNREKIEDLVQSIAAKSNRIVNATVPIVDARLENGARVSMVLPPIALNGPIITVRQFPVHPIEMEQLIAWGAVTEEAVHFLEKLVKAGYNIFISGGTGSGKTTFLNALSNYIPKDERIITIEDNAELQIRGVDNLVRLEARKGNTQGDHEITIRDLIKASLRMRPDRVIVGEVRGEETIDMIQAMNNGHDGSLSTGHGNSPRDMLARLETMILMGMELPVSAVRRQIASGLDIMVHLGRMRDRSRKVLEILEITGYSYEKEEILTHTLYEFEESRKGGEKVEGTLVKKGELEQTRKLERAGLM